MQEVMKTHSLYFEEIYLLWLLANYGDNLVSLHWTRFPLLFPL